MTVQLDVDIYCGDDADQIVGDTWRRLQLALSDETRTRPATRGYARNMRLPMTGRPRYVNVIVYADEAARLGSALAKLKERPGRSRPRLRPVRQDPILAANLGACG